MQSVKNSNEIEGIVTTDERINEIVNGNSALLNHSEQECIFRVKKPIQHGRKYMQIKSDFTMIQAISGRKVFNIKVV